MQLGNYQLLLRIGKGAYGEVWLAQDGNGQFAAVKLIRRDTFETDKPYQRELKGIRAYQQISQSDPNQVRILEVGEEQDFFYYAMELGDDLEGVQVSEPFRYKPKTLRTELTRLGRFSAEEAVRIGAALCDALSTLHKSGLVHRDIKPSNVIFVRGAPKLADLGLVSPRDATITYVGTEGYMPPEGPGTVQGDIYSLGKLLYEISTGQDRCSFPELPTDLRAWNDAPALSGVNEVLMRACHPNPAKRFTSCAALKEALLSAGNPRTRAREQRNRQLRAIATAGLTVAALVLASIWYWSSRMDLQLQAVSGDSTASTNGWVKFNLSKFYNGSLSETWLPGPDGNDLRELLNSQLTNVYDLRGVIQLRGGEYVERGNEVFPLGVEGIQVDKQISKLRFLLGTAGGGEFVPCIGTIRIQLHNSDFEDVPLCYGKNVADFWGAPGAKDSDVPPAWTGLNNAARARGYSVRLYEVAWTNRRPERAVDFISFRANPSARSAPFLVAASGELNSTLPQSSLLSRGREWDAAVQASAEKFPLLPPVEGKKALLTNLTLNTAHIQADGSFGDAIRFKTPSVISGDFALAFRCSLPSLEWQITRRGNQGTPPLEGFVSAPDALLPSGRVQSARCVIQTYPARWLEPNKEYLLWFRRPKPEQFQVEAVWGFVNAGRFSQAEPLGVANELGLQTSNVEKSDFHRHMCLGNAVWQQN